MTNALVRSQNPKWFWWAAASGLAWNIFGVFQFVGSLTASSETMMGNGMTAEQAALTSHLPWWMTTSFAIGVFGGVLGTVLLLMRNKTAKPVLLVSLIAYCVLFIGDITQGVFAAFGIQQVVILTMVIAIAASLYALAWTQK